MKAIQVVDPGKASSLEVAEVSAPEDVAGAVRIRVAAAGVNRADLMQRRGFYPPPPGASEILGLECAGIVEAVAPDVSDWAPGDRVMALLAGGGYAEQVVADAGSLLRVPDAMSLEAAAGVPEVFLTVYLNVFQLAGLGPGESLLVHGGGSGIGTTAIQLAKEAGARVFVTAGSEEKCARCVKLGADAAFDYREGDFAQKVLEVTSGRGVDVILDHIGGRYLDANLRSLATGGRQVTIGLMGGARAELDLGRMLARRLQLFGSTLRARSATEKAALASAFIRRFGEALSSGRIAPVIEKVWPLAEAESAHQQMEASTHFGKIILAVGS